MFLSASATACLEYLRLTPNTPVSPLFYPIASALLSIHSNAALIENLINTSPHHGSLYFSIQAKVTPHTPPHNQETFSLFPSREQTQSNQAPSSPPRTSTPNIPASPSSVPRSPSSLPAEQSVVPANQYHIPASIVAQTASLLLDASGSTLHSYPFQQLQSSDLNCYAAVRLVQHLNPNHVSNASQSVGNGLPTKSYRDFLVHAHLLGKDIVLPTIRFDSRSKEGCTVVSRKELKGIEVKKPDRNGKDENFLLVCIQIMEHGLEGEAGKLFRALAREGLSSKGGCGEWSLYLKKQFLRKRNRANRDHGRRLEDIACGGPERCRVGAALECGLGVRIRDRWLQIGTGSVYPNLSYLMGERLGEEWVVVKLRQVYQIDRERISRDARIDDMMEILQGVRSGGMVKWKRKWIKRIGLVGPEGGVIGSGILVDGNVLRELVKGRGGVYALNEREAERSRRAVLVWDIRLMTGVNRGQKIAVPEWCREEKRPNRIGMHWKEVTASVRIPSVLGELEGGGAGIVLWDRERIVEFQESELFSGVRRE